jgi:hypothetical protein
MEHLPKADLVFDLDLLLIRNVVDLINNVLSDLRREMYHDLTGNSHRTILNGTR